MEIYTLKSWQQSRKIKNKLISLILIDSAINNWQIKRQNKFRAMKILLQYLCKGSVGSLQPGSFFSSRMASALMLLSFAYPFWSTGSVYFNYFGSNTELVHSFLLPT